VGFRLGSKATRRSAGLSTHWKLGSKGQRTGTHTTALDGPGNCGSSLSACRPFFPRRRKKRWKDPRRCRAGRTGSLTDNYKSKGPLTNSDNNLWMGTHQGWGAFRAKDA
jgi:hypothetical protein